MTAIIDPMTYEPNRTLPTLSAPRLNDISAVSSRISNATRPEIKCVSRSAERFSNVIGEIPVSGHESRSNAPRDQQWCGAGRIAVASGNTGDVYTTSTNMRTEI
jgi:hypothetical protein